MEIHTCPSCGAPLPPVAPGTIERCRFCGVEGREGPAPDAAIVPTVCTFDSPLWTYGSRDAKAWLLPPPPPAAQAIIVMEVAQPYPFVASDKSVASMSASLVAEAIWMTTDVPATAGALLARKLRKVYIPAEPVSSFAVYEPFLDGLESRPIVIWGEATQDPFSEGVEWRARVPGLTAEERFSGPPARATEAIVSWLVDLGVARRVQPLAWWTPPWAARARSQAMDCLRVQILVDDGFVSVDPEGQTYYADQTLSLAEAYPSEVQTMIAAASAHYARKAGALTPALRKRALSLIESHGDPRSPVTWLSPHWLASLASDEAGRARRARMEPGASGPYLAWLRSIAVPET